MGKNKSFVLGGHGDTMVAMLNHTKLTVYQLKIVESGKLTQKDLESLVDRTKKGGAK